MPDIEKLLELMRALRESNSGCPWDLEQDFASVAPFTIEEAYEVADAIQRHDMDGLRDELGDLLFQVVFHAQMAAEKGCFNFDDVVGAITAKMTHRHPHVFGDEKQRAQGMPAGAWEDIKAAERHTAGDDSAMAGVARALPALSRARKLGRRANRVGFDWPDRKGVRDKIREELDELESAVGTRDESAIEEEFGDVLFAVVNLARHLEIDPESALTQANSKFERRFREMETDILASGHSLKELALETLEQHWRAAKKRVG